MTVEDIENRRKRLIYRSWHRGTREMDLILGPFADAHASSFTGEEIAEYEALLEESDVDLYNWISGAEALPTRLRGGVLERLFKPS